MNLENIYTYLQNLHCTLRCDNGNNKFFLIRFRLDNSKFMNTYRIHLLHLRQKGIKH